MSHCECFFTENLCRCVSFFSLSCEFHGRTKKLAKPESIYSIKIKETFKYTFFHWKVTIPLSTAPSVSTGISPLECRPMKIDHSKMVPSKTKSFYHCERSLTCHCTHVNSCAQITAPLPSLLHRLLIMCYRSSLSVSARTIAATPFVDSPNQEP